MRRRKTSDGEYDQVQRLRHENKRLKNQISQLRKQLSRVDIDRFQNLKDLIESQEREDQAETKAEEQKKIEQDWKCFECKSGTIRLVVLERKDGVFYYRICDRCPKRTKIKRYNSDVKGVK